MEFRGPAWLTRSTIAAGSTATVASLVLLYLDVSGRLASWGEALVLWLDTALCAVMMAEWFVLLNRAHDRWRFVRARWIDLLASLPLLLALRPFRIVRLLRLLRLLRGLLLMRKVLRPWERAMDTALLKSAALTGAVIIVLSAVAVADLERENPQLDELRESLWWAVVTASTVGYGDRYPLTPGGQVIAVVLMIVGIGLFGTLAASLVAALAPRRPEVTNQDLLRRMDELEARLGELIRNRG